jgi:hypothetical protein
LRWARRKVMPERGRRALAPWEIAARHRNAQKSTGPRTPRGKRRAALNALRTGDYARRRGGERLFFSQAPPEFRRMLSDLIALLDPAEDRDIAFEAVDLAREFWVKWECMRVRRQFRQPEAATTEDDARLQACLEWVLSALRGRSRKWRSRLAAALAGPVDSLPDLRRRIEARLSVFQELEKGLCSPSFRTKNKGSLIRRPAILYLIEKTRLASRDPKNEPNAAIPCALNGIGPENDENVANIRA